MSKRIVIADEELVVGKAIEFSLLKEGFEVSSFIDGDAAIEDIKSHLPDLVITELTLPYKTGLELINVVRNDLDSDIPILVLSKLAMRALKHEALELGATDYLVKPVHMSELIKLIIKRIG